MADRRVTEPSSDTDTGAGRTGLVRFAWGTLVLNILVILWGAFVRASGSGAGCGNNWPLCNGAVVPSATATGGTLVEFAHRVTSGFALVAVFVLAFLVWRRLPKGHLARPAVAASAVFIVGEALIGAGLVLFELVAENASIARAQWMAMHLLNSFLLLGALTLTARWVGQREPRLQLRGQGTVGTLLLLGGAAVVGLGISGAVTALGDTLYLAATARGSQPSATAEFLIGLRVYHPIFAVLVAGLVTILGPVVERGRPTRTTAYAARTMIGLFLVQLGVGALNVSLRAPAWMQMIHLLMADLVWIAFVVLAAAALDPRARPVAARSPDGEPRSVAAALS